MESDLPTEQQVLHSDSRSPTPVEGNPNESPPPSAKDPAVHKRNYQACVPCRTRKVKCDLGSVDSPDSPPCKRCKREKKDCWFTDERRRPRAEGDGSQEPQSGGGAHAHKRRSLSLEQAVRPLSFAAQKELHELMQTQQKLKARERLGRAIVNDPNSRIESEVAQQQFTGPVHNQGDVLHLLLSAATEHDTAKPIPNLTRHTNSIPHTDMSDPQLTESLKAWKSLRFVRAGTFTVAEGIKYVEYYFEEMAPLTPIFVTNYRDIKTHADLLKNEPVLAVTILTIASRYMALGGPSAHTRSFKVHEQMWNFLQGMVTRMFWGQEQFGSGFCVTGGDMTTAEGAQARRRSLRSLGAAESLLLLSDWLPRSMHFNPLDDCGELLASDQESGNLISAPDDPRATWIEPAQRSDRLCWTLVSMAHTLAVELGVYDSFLETKLWSPGPQPKTAYANQRAGRLGRMVYIYVTQTCGRLVLPNTLPQPAENASSNFLKMDVPEGRFPSPYGLITEADKVQRAWAELTTLIRKSNESMFDSREKTRDATRNASYGGFINGFGEHLRNWRDKLEGMIIDATAKTVLMIEYQHARMFIYSLALQAVLDKIEDARGSQKSKSAFLSDEIRETYKSNWVHIQQVIEASRDILHMAVKSLDGNLLKHAPVRTFFRILAGAVFLLKTVALGGKEGEITRSLNLLSSTVDALRGSSVDDVHLSIRFADLLDELLIATHAKLRVIKIGGKKSGQLSNAQSSTESPSRATAAPTQSNGLDPKNLYAALPFDRPPEADLTNPNTTLMAPIDFAPLDVGTPFSANASHPQALPQSLPAPSGIGLSSPQADAFGYSSTSQAGSSHTAVPVSSTIPEFASAAPLAGEDSPGGNFWAAADFHDFFGDPATQPTELPAYVSPANHLDLFNNGITFTDCNPLGPYMAQGVGFLGAMGGWTTPGTHATRANVPHSQPYPGLGLGGTNGTWNHGGGDHDDDPS